MTEPQSIDQLRAELNHLKNAPLEPFARALCDALGVDADSTTETGYVWEEYVEVVHAVLRWRPVSELPKQPPFGTRIIAVRIDPDLQVFRNTHDLFWTGQSWQGWPALLKPATHFILRPFPP